MGKLTINALVFIAAVPSCFDLLINYCLNKRFAENFKTSILNRPLSSQDQGRSAYYSVNTDDKRFSYVSFIMRKKSNDKENVRYMTRSAK